MSDFDKEAMLFTHSLKVAADWKHNYFGAAYSTRLKAAIEDVRAACIQMERVLDADAATHTS